MVFPSGHGNWRFFLFGEQSGVPTASEVDFNQGDACYDDNTCTEQEVTSTYVEEGSTGKVRFPLLMSALFRFSFLFSFFVFAVLPFSSCGLNRAPVCLLCHPSCVSIILLPCSSGIVTFDANLAERMTVWARYYAKEDLVRGSALPFPCRACRLISIHTSAGSPVSFLALLSAKPEHRCSDRGKRQTADYP